MPWSGAERARESAPPVRPRHSSMSRARRRSERPASPAQPAVHELLFRLAGVRGKWRCIDTESGPLQRPVGSTDAGAGWSPGTRGRAGAEHPAAGRRAYVPARRKPPRLVRVNRVADWGVGAQSRVVARVGREPFLVRASTRARSRAMMPHSHAKSWVTCGALRRFPCRVPTSRGARAVDPLTCPLMVISVPAACCSRTTRQASIVAKTSRSSEASRRLGAGCCGLHADWAGACDSSGPVQRLSAAHTS